MAPDIRAVAGHIEGDISKDVDIESRGKLSKLHPLPAEMPLKQFLLEKSALMLKPPVPQGLLVVNGQLLRPLPPRTSMVLIAQHHECGVIN
tara:strand:- start:277 stop:549 length:273 start_codon:yes stop_codon:yes gene_type:complete